MAKAATYDPTTAAGKIRLTISDVDIVDAVFSDVEIDAFLSMGGDNWQLGAAYALDTIASNEVLVAKVVKTMDLETDGAKVAAALRAHASTLRSEAEADADDWAIAEFAAPVFQQRERLVNELWRSADL